MRYTIEGDHLPVVICHLAAGEAMFNQSGSMAWMSPICRWKPMPKAGLANLSAECLREILFFKTPIPPGAATV